MKTYFLLFLVTTLLSASTKTFGDRNTSNYLACIGNHKPENNLCGSECIFFQKYSDLASKRNENQSTLTNQLDFLALSDNLKLYLSYRLLSEIKPPIHDVSDNLFVQYDLHDDSFKFIRANIPCSTLSVKAIYEDEKIVINGCKDIHSNRNKTKLDGNSIYIINLKTGKTSKHSITFDFTKKMYFDNGGNTLYFSDSSHIYQLDLTSNNVNTIFSIAKPFYATTSTNKVVPVNVIKSFIVNKNKLYVSMIAHDNAPLLIAFNIIKKEYIGVYHIPDNIVIIDMNIFDEYLYFKYWNRGYIKLHGNGIGYIKLSQTSSLSVRYLEIPDLRNLHVVNNEFIYLEVFNKNNRCILKTSGKNLFEKSLTSSFESFFFSSF